MPKISRRFAIVLLLTLTACSTDEPSESETVSADPETSFASYVQDLYRELNETPLSDSVQIDIGMFGDLNVMAGENVVMGRYRYRVDSTRGNVSGHLTFFARSAADDEAVPVVLLFDDEGGSWALRAATYVPSDEDDSEASQVEQILDRRLDEWAEQAADDVATALH